MKAVSITTWCPSFFYFLLPFYKEGTKSELYAFFLEAKLLAQLDGLRRERRANSACRWQFYKAQL
jgi:hypothetical protein